MVDAPVAMMAGSGIDMKAMRQAHEQESEQVGLKYGSKRGQYHTAKIS
jgi:hypothetical protein